MFSDLDSVDWTRIINDELPSDVMATQFYETLWPKFETCFPLIMLVNFIFECDLKLHKTPNFQNGNFFIQRNTYHRGFIPGSRGLRL